MHRIAPAAAVVFAAGLALSLAGLGAGLGRSYHASLRLTMIAPLEVAGSHFRSHERIRVTAVVGSARRTSRVQASGMGSFVSRFAIGGGHCTSIRVVAVGQAGSRATLKRLPAPACMHA
jgi:hypothetical protein